MHQTIHTSEHRSTSAPAPHRPAIRPTIYRPTRHVLESVDEDMLTGLGAATETPTFRLA